MERFFGFIERLRQYPEAVRRQILWVAVALAGAVIAAAWIAALSWQFHGVRADVEQPPEDGERLPEPAEAVRNQQRALTGELREALRGFLLEQDAVSQEGENSDGGTETEAEEPEPPALPTGETPPRLPRETEYEKP